jgi:2-haloacid dehalogenase
MDVSSIKALTFDVFGTVVDWRTTIIAEGEEIGKAKGLTIDWARFADTWRAGYFSSMDLVRSKKLPWTNIDTLHRMVLDNLLIEFGIAGLGEAEKYRLNLVWHRLKPWPDAIPGLNRLRTRYIIATLSNGNMALLTNMAKNAGLPWDCILSAELAKRYKPDPEAYLMAADLLGLRTDQVMHVAAHKADLKAAHSQGMKTGFVPRPLEYGPTREVETTPEPWMDLFATDFEDLATKLGT